MLYTGEHWSNILEVRSEDLHQKSGQGTKHIRLEIDAKAWGDAVYLTQQLTWQEVDGGVRSNTGISSLWVSGQGATP